MSSRRICEDPFCYRIAPARYSLTLTDPHLRETSRSLGWGYLLPASAIKLDPSRDVHQVEAAAAGGDNTGTSSPDCSDCVSDSDSSTSPTK